MMVMMVMIIIIMAIIHSVSSDRDFYKVSLLIPATMLCSDYSHFADLEAESQGSTVSDLPIVNSEISDI